MMDTAWKDTTAGGLGGRLWNEAMNDIERVLELDCFVIVASSVLKSRVVTYCLFNIRNVSGNVAVYLQIQGLSEYLIKLERFYQYN